MANFSNTPATGLPGFRSETPTKRSSARLQAVPQAQNSKPAEAPDSTALPLTGPRKLVRPTLPARSFRNRAFSPHDDPPILAHQNLSAQAGSHESTHAEAFYFQKQIQTQTPIIVVLEDGEQVEGLLEWYDRNAIKIKGHARTMVYKSAIKYIYKAGEKRF